MPRRSIHTCSTGHEVAGSGDGSRCDDGVLQDSLCADGIGVCVEGARTSAVNSGLADTVIVAERCTVRIMPEGTSSVVQREVQRVRMMRDTVSVLRTDTVRVVQPQPYQSRGKTHEMIYGKIWWWMMAGAVLGLGAIALLRKIYRCRI